MFINLGLVVRMSRKLSSSETNSSESYKCNVCEMTFRSLGEMNNHKIEQHLQKGDIPSEEKK